MIELLERLNVRAEERRVAICIFFGFFIVLNGLWAWRFFSGETKWTDLKAAIRKDSRESKKLKTALADLKQKEADWEESKEGGQVERIDLNRRVIQIARAEGLKYGRATNPRPIDDPEFKSFKKHTVSLDFTASDNSLVKFLIALASEPQMVRVSSLTLRRPNNNPKILAGNISIVTSFPRPKEEGEENKEPEVKDNKS